MKVYKGIRGTDGVAYVFAAQPNTPDRALAYKRFTTGLDWGYSGSGPAQCALALLTDALGDDLRANLVHQGFHHLVIARLPRHLPWQLTQAQVVAMVEEIEQTVAG